MPLQGPTHQQLHLALERSQHSRWPELLGSRCMLLEIHKQMKLLYSSKLRHSYWLAMAKVSADVPAFVKSGSKCKDWYWFCFETVQSTYHRDIYWKCKTCCTLEGTVSPIDALTHGWEHDGYFLKRTTVPEGALSATVAVLEMMRYGCASGCKGGPCKWSTIGCTFFCACKGGEVCMNMLTKKSQESVPVDDNNDNDDEL